MGRKLLINLSRGNCMIRFLKLIPMELWGNYFCPRPVRNLSKNFRFSIFHISMGRVSKKLIGSPWSLCSKLKPLSHTPLEIFWGILRYKICSFSRCWLTLKISTATKSWRRVLFSNFYTNWMGTTLGFRYNSRDSGTWRSILLKLESGATGGTWRIIRCTTLEMFLTGREKKTSLRVRRQCVINLWRDFIKVSKGWLFLSSTRNLSSPAIPESTSTISSFKLSMHRSSSVLCKESTRYQKWW